MTGHPAIGAPSRPRLRAAAAALAHSLRLLTADRTLAHAAKDLGVEHELIANK